MLKPGWYILNYHEVNWEESDYLRPIGGSFPPDVFYEHCRALAKLGTLVGVQEGEELLGANKLDRPFISFWFDDGLTGVRRYAKPVLDQFKVPGAVSVNSRFVDRTEMFWWMKLGFLQSVDGMRFVRSRLRKLGFKRGDSVRNFVLDNFSEEVVAILDSVYEKFTRVSDRLDAFRMFDSWDDHRSLEKAGWLIANHSAAHYPVSENSFIAKFLEQFSECEARIETEMGRPSRHWVAPFDRGHRADALDQTFAACGGDRKLVLVGNRFNRAGQAANRICRIAMWEDTAAGLPSKLAAIQPA